MPLESGNFISDLDQTFPTVTDPTSEGDNHLRLVKHVLKSTFIGKAGEGYAKTITATEDDLNALTGLADMELGDLPTILDNKVNKDGDTMTGDLEVPNVDVSGGITTGTLNATGLSQLVDVECDNVTGKAISGTTVTASTSTTTPALTIGTWSITVDDGSLVFSSGGVKRFKMNADGTIVAQGNITGYGTV